MTSLHTLVKVALFVFIQIPLWAYAQPERVWINHQFYTLSLPNRNIQLQSVVNDLLIEFSPITGDSVYYYYRLSPSQANWTKSRYPAVHYHNISGGSYTLQFYARSNTMRSALVQIPIEVERRFWEKTWFGIILSLYLILLVAIAIYLFFLYNYRQKLKLLNIRTKLAADLHDEVGANLSSIAIYVALLRQKIPKNIALVSILDKITENSEESVTLMRDTVWAINPNNDSVDQLISRCRSVGKELLSAKGIRFSIVVDESFQRLSLHMELRRNIYLLYKEALHNIVKHSQATESLVRFQAKGNSWSVMIHDNGVGFDPALVYEGNGLRNFVLRGQEADLRVQVTSQEGQGTTILIEGTA
jgi:hypothetical protein